MRKKWVVFFLLTASLFLMAFRSPADTEVEFLNGDQFYKFGEEIVFQVKIKTEAILKESYILIQPAGSPARMEKISPNLLGEVVFKYALENTPLRPFTDVTYWYRTITSDGQVHESEHYTFAYIDNHYPWQSLSDDTFQVNWYQGDQLFGQSLLNIAHEGLKSAQDYIPIIPNEKIKIFVYSSASDLQSSLQIDDQNWIAGQASPDLLTVLISSPSGPDQRLELERQLPHELAHILQYQNFKTGYQRLPIWILEGTASLSEIYPNPDYERILERAAKNNTLISMSSLCEQFPQEASSAFLAYAQSESFMRFLYQKFGASKMIELGQKYADGVGCEEGVTTVLETSLGLLDAQWQQETLKINTNILAFNNLAPYIGLSILLFVPILIGILIALRG